MLGTLANYAQILSVIPLFGGAATLIVRHQCHEHRCMRPAWHPDETGHPKCKRHHPDHPRGR